MPLVLSNHATFTPPFINRRYNTGTPIKSVGTTGLHGDGVSKDKRNTLIGVSKSQEGKMGFYVHRNHYGLLGTGTLGGGGGEWVGHLYI